MPCPNKSLPANKMGHFPITYTTILCFKRHFKIRECKCCLLQFREDPHQSMRCMILKEMYDVHTDGSLDAHRHTHTPDSVTEELLKEIYSFSKTSDQNRQTRTCQKSFKTLQMICMFEITFCNTAKMCSSSPLQQQITFLGSKLCYG